jgi:hypothetical protein
LVSWAGRRMFNTTLNVVYARETSLSREGVTFDPRGARGGICTRTGVLILSAALMRGLHRKG